MSRVSYNEEEEYPGQFDLWQANLRRAKHGKRGRAALTDLRDALLALPRKRLISRRLAADGDVCTVGALLLLRESRALGSMEAAQAKLEQIGTYCDCGHAKSQHDADGCHACRVSHARDRIRRESGDGYNGSQFLPRPWSEGQWWAGLGRPFCHGFHAAPEDDDQYDYDEASVSLAEASGVPHILAWNLVAQNDDGEFGYGGLTPEERYARVLRDVERELAAPS